MATKTFEQSMKQLEQIIHDLESGDLPLEKAVKKFEEGIGLSKHCAEILDKTEKKITILLKNQAGDILEKQFLEDEIEAGEDL